MDPHHTLMSPIYALDRISSSASAGSFHVSVTGRHHWQIEVVIMTSMSETRRDMFSGISRGQDGANATEQGARRYFCGSVRVMHCGFFFPRVVPSNRRSRQQLNLTEPVFVLRGRGRNERILLTKRKSIRDGRFSLTLTTG